MKKIVLSLAAAAVAAPMLLLGGGVASAAPVRPADDGSVYFYWDSNGGGDVWVGGPYRYPDLAQYYYPQNGLPGAGQRVKNNAASVYNGTPGWVCVFYDENYGGAHDDIAPGQLKNLVQTWNNNASYTNWLPSSYDPCSQR